jgi:hypothetical protein
VLLQVTLLQNNWLRLAWQVLESMQLFAAFDVCCCCVIPAVLVVIIGYAIMTYAAPLSCMLLSSQVNFDPERFVGYITKADDFLELIRSKLAQAGVQGRPTAAQLPWFDLQVG